MNKDNLQAQVSNMLLRVREKKLALEVAVKDICLLFHSYAEWSNDPKVVSGIEGLERRVREAVENFLTDVDPKKPGIAIHDAIDHMFHG